MFYTSILESNDERNSFQNIYEENYSKMYHVALGILKDQMDAENAVHAAFLSIAENYKNILTFLTVKWPAYVLL